MALNIKQFFNKNLQKKSIKYLIIIKKNQLYPILSRSY